VYSCRETRVQISKNERHKANTCQRRKEEMYCS
jgi:hypothetical protein